MSKDSADLIQEEEGTGVPEVLPSPGEAQATPETKIPVREANLKERE